MQVELGWPAKALSPNFRSSTHWARTKALKRAKNEGYYATLAAALAAGNPRLDDLNNGERVKLIITAYPPDRQKRDDDNLIASLKGHRDGIAQALRIDDSLFDQGSIQWAEPAKRGKVVVTLEPAA